MNRGGNSGLVFDVRVDTGTVASPGPSAASQRNERGRRRGNAFTVSETAIISGLRRSARLNRGGNSGLAFDVHVDTAARNTTHTAATITDPGVAATTGSAIAAVGSNAGGNSGDGGNQVNPTYPTAHGYFN